MSESVQPVEIAAEVVEPVAEVVAAQVEVPAAVPKEPDLSAKFAELKRQEKALRAERHQAKQSIEAARAEWVAQLKADPLKYVQEHGVTPDQIAQALLGQVQEPAKPDPVAAIEERLRRFEQAEQEKLLTDFKASVFSHVEKLPDEYELILQSKGGRDTYLQAVAGYINTYGEAPNYLELASEVESALLEDAKAYTSLKKLQPPKPQVPVQKEAPAVDQSALSKLKTLSSSMRADAFGSIKVSSVEKGSARPARSEYQSFMDDAMARAKALAKLS